MTIPMPEPEYAKYRTDLPHRIDLKEWDYTSVITVNNYLRHHKWVNEFGKPGEQGRGMEFQVEWLITTTQAEAYKDACVHEALEKAALAIGEPILVEALIENFSWVSAENHARAHQILADAKQTIRALIPQQ